MASATGFPGPGAKGPPLVIVGAHSTAGKAISRLWPDDRTLKVHRGSGSGIAVEDYRTVPHGAIPRGAVVVNCVGTPRGTPAELRAVNREVAEIWAEAAMAAGAQHFIQLSSFSVYGRQSLIGQATQEAPVNAYGESKLAADRALETMCGDRLRLSIVRIPMLCSEGPDKLSHLVKFVATIRAVPKLQPPVRRAMLTYPALAEGVVQLIRAERGGTVLFADPTNFTYELLAERFAAAGLSRPRAVPVPRWASALTARFAAPIHARLLRSSEVEPGSAYPLTISPEARLETLIDRLVRDGKRG